MFTASLSIKSNVPVPEVVKLPQSNEGSIMHYLNSIRAPRSAEDPAATLQHSLAASALFDFDFMAH